MSQQADNAALKIENTVLKTENVSLKQRLAWFEKQLFGQKSERRLIEDNPQQQVLDGLIGETLCPPPQTTETVTYQRGKARKHRGEDCVNDSGLRFNKDVPIEVIRVAVPELSGPHADDYDVISIKTSHRLAQRPASYVVLQYEMPVVKRRSSGELINASAPAAVLDRSIADVSLLAGLLVDKFLFHLPLYRQHQRINQAGIELSRATLTNLVKRSIDLLRPVVRAQLAHVLQSKVLAMDETPIKAGRAGKGKLKTGWFWPLYGEDDEVVFTYSDSRARQHIEQTLNQQFSGTLVSDGYAAYGRYVKETAGLTHAQCWSHTRRKFIDAETSEPALVATALDYIGALYRHEKRLAKQGMQGEKKRDYRLEYIKPVVEAFFTWCEQQCLRADLLPDNPFIKAVNYTLARTVELKVFLADPGVPPDTNHLERALRPIPMGRRNWLFCWTELGAEHVGIIQSLIVTCKLHQIDPYVYLVDVLQRINVHAASDVESLTPRRWKEKFAAAPLQSDLGRVNNVVE